ncbi:MAG: hypothetical protein ING55_08110 [Rhodocyclaceae bacterium]|nr:hypothetical protein [Rhodocyclaceae bacterium]
MSSSGKTRAANCATTFEVASYDRPMRKRVLLSGLLCGILIAGLKFIEYRWLVVEHSIETYGGLVAAVFAAVGIWLGLRLTRKVGTVVVREVMVPAPEHFTRDEAAVGERSAEITMPVSCPVLCRFSEDILAAIV